jgi:hypothetical protein
VGHPKKCLPIARAANPPNRAFTKELIRTSSPIAKLEQGAVIRFFTLKGFQRHQIHAEPDDMYHEQAFQLPAWQKRHLRFAERTKRIDDETKSRRPTRPDLAGPIAKLLHDRPFPSCKAIRT